MPSLEIHDQDGEQTLPLAADALVCGRLEDSDLVLSDPRCSKKHCRFERKGGRWRLVDLASANGTWVNGQSISMVELEDGDEVVVGDVRIVFRSGPGRAPEIGRSERRGAASKAPILLAGIAVLIAVTAFLVKGGPGSAPGTSETETSEEASEPVRPEAAGGELAFLRSSLRTEWGALETDRRSPATEVAARARELAERAVEVDPKLAAQAVSWAEARERAELDRQQGRLRDTRLAALREAEAGRFAIGLAELDELQVEFQALGLDRLVREAREVRIELLGRARAAWEGIEREGETLADAGDFEKARDLLTEAAPGFGGTAFEAVARSSVQLLEIRARGREVEEAEARAPEGRRPVVEKVDDSAAGLIAEAEKAAASRDWKKAAEGYARALTLARGDSLIRSWTRRADLLGSLARLKDAVVVAVNAEDRRVRSLKIGRLSARPFAADQESIQLKFGGSGLVTWNWREVPGDTLLDLFQFGIENNEDQLDFARAAIEFGDEKRALGALVKATRNKARKDEADAIFAAWRGREVPPGGFIVEEGGFWGPEEWAAVELRREARKDAEKLVKARRSQLPDLVTLLRAKGEPAFEPLQAALEERYALVLEDAEKLAVIASPGRYRGKLLDELDRRRAEALALIRDEKRYPYPYGANQEEVQAEVNALVERVRQVYEQPSIFLLEQDKALGEKLGELEEIVALMLGPSDERPKPLAFLDRVDEAIDMRTHGRSSSDQRHNEEVTVFDAEIKSSITPEEREVHRLTNEYRMLMGLRAVKIDEALVLAARGHSQEMKDLGYFAHNSPTKGRETPGQRCRLAGWGGSASENIARGQRTPAAAVQGWINSSGHHRNILGSRWTHLGCGKAKDGFFWTQNFGSGTSSAISREKIDPAEAPDAEKQRGAGPR